MSRSGYSDDCNGGALNLWRANVDRTLGSKRGQAFLRELAEKMDAMPEKKLIAGDLVTPAGECCTIGVVCKARGVNVEGVDVYDPEAVSSLVGISSMMAQEIEYLNDEVGRYHVDENGRYRPEKPEERWQRMREWVRSEIRGGANGATE